MSREDLHPLLRFQLVRDAERGAIQRSLRDRRRRALERPAARAEADRALAELDDDAYADAEDWLVALTTLALLDTDDELDIDHAARTAGVPARRGRRGQHHASRRALRRQRRAARGDRRRRQSRLVTIEHRPLVVRADDPRVELVAVPCELLAELRAAGGIRNVRVEVVMGGPPAGSGLQLVVHRD